jgi:hypothetical protein
MEALIPYIVLCGAAAALAIALYSVWQSLRAAFGGPELMTLAELDAVGAKRAALLEEKEGLLAALGDLAFDHESAKVSDEDYAKSERRLRDRAKAVMKELDGDTEEHRARAEALIAARLADVGLAEAGKASPKP